MSKPTVEIEVPGKATLHLEVSETIALKTLNFVMAHYVAEKERESQKRQEFDAARPAPTDPLNSPRPKANPTEPTRGKK